MGRNIDRKIPITEGAWPEEILRDIEAFNQDVDQAAGLSFARLSPEGEVESGPESDLESGPERDPALEKLEAVYGAADGISIVNAQKHRRSIWLFSVCATLLTSAFLLYDEVYLYWMVLVCIFLLLALFAINLAARRIRCHRRYLDYRLLAETLRVQWYLRSAGLSAAVSDMLPWSVRTDTPWIVAALKTLYPGSSGDSGGTSPKRTGRSMLEPWILDQKNYHQAALRKSEAQMKHNDRIVIIALIATVLTYLITLVFEISCGGLLGGEVRLDPAQMEFARMILKVLMGTMSAATLFTGNYYGKLSLQEITADHRRMAELYAKVEKEIREHGETEELLLRLAREELIENSSWYAYQNKNKPEISL